MPPILAATGLCFLDFLRYPPIAVEQGSMTFVQGPSGCGKSTLLRLFNATLSPSAGQVLFDGQDIMGLNTIQLRRDVLLVSQATYLFDDTIEGNFLRYYELREQTPPTQQQMRDCLALCCADFELSASCSTLSGGERQRVFLAIFLSFAPRVLLLDEPTSALDEATARQLMEQLKAHCVAQQITVVVVSHDHQLAQQYADATIILAKGAAQ